MRKKVILIVSVLIIVSLFLVIKFNGGERTIEEAINTSSLKPVSIIHEKKNDKGTIGLSAEGKELTKIDGDIFPYYAEQKPFKGYE